MFPLSALRIDSPLGPITLAASATGLCGLWFDDQKHSPTPAQRQHCDARVQHLPPLRRVKDETIAVKPGPAPTGEQLHPQSGKTGKPCPQQGRAFHCHRKHPPR